LESIKKCSFPGCDQPLLARGLCNAHYIQRRKGKPLTALGRKVKFSCCGQFGVEDHPHECAKAGPKVRLTADERRQNANDYQSRYRSEWIERPGKREQLRATGKRYRDRVRYECLVVYSQDPPSCACCGEIELVFLTLDHVGGGGAEERRQGKHKGGTWQYLILRRKQYPPGYRVLCWNCNAAFGMFGECPHQIEKKVFQWTR
jgi:hypothetical protein